MPTPIDTLPDPISLAVIAIFAAFALREAIAPGRPLPRVRGWHALGTPAGAAAGRLLYEPAAGALRPPGSIHD